MSQSATGHLVIHSGDVDFYYLDFGPILRGRTISAISGTITAVNQTGGAAGTVANAAVLTVNTTVYVTETDTRTIEANTGIKFKLSGLAPKQTYLVTATVTLSDANTLALDGTFVTG